MSCTEKISNFFWKKERENRLPTMETCDQAQKKSCSEGLSCATIFDKLFFRQNDPNSPNWPSQCVKRLRMFHSEECFWTYTANDFDYVKMILATCFQMVVSGECFYGLGTHVYIGITQRDEIYHFSLKEALSTMHTYIYPYTQYVHT
jgi:hypothetical protein